jgi:Ca2+/Na+ antiporter
MKLLGYPYYEYAMISGIICIVTYASMNAMKMYKFRYYFLASSLMLICMGSLQSNEGSSSYTSTIIGGILNFALFVYLQFMNKLKKQPTKN